eukprot:12067914-Prorocentrum_lima.AAC.1
MPTSCEDAWVVSPPIAGISDLAKDIRRSHWDANERVTVTSDQAAWYNRVNEELHNTVGLRDLHRA